MREVQRHRENLVVLITAVIAACGGQGAGTLATSGAAPAMDAGAGFVDPFDAAADTAARDHADAASDEGAGAAAEVDAATSVPSVASLVASVDAPIAQVGAPITIHCEARASDGTPLATQPPGLALQAAAPLQVLAAAAGFGLAVTSKQAGAFDVRCALPTFGLTSAPVQVTFTAGPAAKVVTKLDKPTVTAGDAGSAVTCAALDAFGNPLLASAGGAVEAAIGADPALVVAIDTVSGEKAGAFAVWCIPKGAAAAWPVEKAVLTVVPGPAMRARAVITPKSAVVDTPMAVVCTAYDDFDNPIDPQPDDFALELPAGCFGNGLGFSCQKAGDHTLSCASKAVPKSIAAPFEIVAGKAVSLTLKLDPDQPNYGTGQVIQLLGEATDTYGNPLKTPVLKPIQIKPAELVTVDALNARVSFGQDGKYEIKVGVEGAPGVSATRVVLVDTSGPLIDVSSPPRGHETLWASTMKVTLSVVDELSKLGDVLFLGKAIAVGDGIGVGQTMPLGHGIQAIAIDAKDQWGNASRHVQAVLSAKKFVASETKSGAAAQLGHGFSFWLGQKAIDSGVRVHSKPRDLATVLEIVLKNLDLSVIVGQSFPIDVTGLSGDATVKGLTFGDNSKNKGYPQIKLQAKAGVLALDATLWKVEAKVNLKGKGIGFVPVNIDATVTAASMRLLADIALGAGSGGVTVKTKNVTVQLQELDVNIDNGWGFLVNWLLDLFDGAITDLFESTLATQLGAAVDGPLGAALGGIGLDTSLTLPSLYGAPAVAVALATAPVGLSVSAASGPKAAGALLTLRTSLTSTKKVVHPHLGAPLRWSCLGNGPTLAALPRTQPLEGAMHFDLANQLFAALWQAGGLAFKLDASALAGFDLKSFGLGAIAIDVDMWMAPVLSDCTPDGSVELQLGDVQLDLTTVMDGKKVVIRAYLTAAAQVGAIKVAGPNGAEIGLDVKSIVRLDGDVDSVLIDGVAAPEGTVGFFEKLLPLVASALVGALQGTLASFPLPQLDLSAMAASIPKGTVLALDIGSVGSQPGHVVLGGGVAD